MEAARAPRAVQHRPREDGDVPDKPADWRPDFEIINAVDLEEVIEHLKQRRLHKVLVVMVVHLHKPT